MATRIKYEGNDTTRRHPRTLMEAFPRDHALWHEPGGQRSLLDSLGWFFGVVLTLALFIAPLLWRYFHA